MANQKNRHPAAVKLSTDALRGRYEADITLEEAGRQAGVSHMTVWEFENNRGISLNNAAAILDVLGYDLIAIKREVKNG